MLVDRCLAEAGPGGPFLTTRRHAETNGIDCLVRRVQQGASLHATLLALRMSLAAMFLVAAVAKLTDREGAREGTTGFGVPPALATPFMFGLPLLELVVAGLLIPRNTVLLGAILALALFVAFAGSITVNMVRGRNAECHCFGALYSERVGWRSLSRNIALGLAAALLVWGADDPAASRTTLGEDTWPILLTAGIVLAAGTVVGSRLLREQRSVRLRIEALEALVASGGAIRGTATPAAASAVRDIPIGAPAPTFEVRRLDGQTASLGTLLSKGRPVLLLFTSPHCKPCRSLLPTVAQWQRESSDRLTVAVIGQDDLEANRGDAAEYNLQDVYVEGTQAVRDAYRAHGTPMAVLVRPDGTIGSPVVTGAARVRSLAGQLLEAEPPVATKGATRSSHISPG